MSWRKWLFAVGLSIGLVIFLRQIWVSYEAIQQHEFSLVRPTYLLAALGASLLMYLLQMLAWMMIMRHLGVSLSLRQTVQGYCLSFLPRYIPGSVWGYLGRSQWLEQSHSVDYVVSMVGSILEALALVLTGLLMTGTYFCARSVGSEQIVLTLAGAALLGGTLLIVPRVVMQIGRRVYRGRLSSQLSNGCRLGAWSSAIALYLALWIAFGSSILFLGNAILVDPTDDLLAAISASSLSWLLGFIVVIVPTGLGIRELALATLLSSYGGFLPWQAEVVAVTSRFAIILAELVWLLIGLGLYAHKWRRDRAHRVASTPFSEE